MKLLPLLAAGLLLTSSFALADSYSFREPIKQSAPFNADGVLTLTNVNGPVEVKTWDKAEILVEGEKSAKTEEELQRIDFTASLTPGDAKIKVTLPKRHDSFWGGNTIRASVRLTVTMPATARIGHLDTVNSNLTISGVRGDVKAETVNGRIDATGLSAYAHLETVNGSIHAAFASLSPTQSVHLETVNGSITATLPKDANADLRASVVNGTISCDLPITLGSGKHRHSLKGSLGKGGPELRAESVNGSIHFVAK